MSMLGQLLIVDDHFEEYESLKNTASNKEEKFGILDEIHDGFEFESYIASLLKKNDFENVEVTKKSGDYGIDVLAKKDKIKYAIQCKLYSQPVGNKAIQEASAGKKYYNCHIAIVATNNGFTRNAIELADKIGVVLWDRDKILSMEKVLKLDNYNDSLEFDKLYENTIPVVWRAGYASMSLLQNILKIGNAQAKKLMDELEKNKVITPAVGNDVIPRSVLWGKIEYLLKYI